MRSMIGKEDEEDDDEGEKRKFRKFVQPFSAQNVRRSDQILACSLEFGNETTATERERGSKKGMKHQSSISDSPFTYITS